MMLGNECLYCSLKESIVSPIERTDAPVEIRETLHEETPDIRVSCSFENNILASGNGDLAICTISINNHVGECDVSITMRIDGEIDAVTPVAIAGHRVTEIPVTTGSKRFRVEYGTDFDISMEVATRGIILYKQGSTVHVRPIFDVSLKEIKEDIPLWVTPGAREIKSLITKNGPILSALTRNGGDGTISGYQGSDANDIINSVTRQMAAVYDGLMSLGFHYVSDTESMGNALTGNFQRVKLPRKVLEERTGNCIELSCLFASVFEEMGLHPVIVFPPGHAMVGVLISSKRLADMGNHRYANEPPVFEFELGDIGDGSSDRMQALFLEATAICADMTFKQSVSSAYDTLRKNEKRIKSGEDYTVMPYKRRFGGKRPMNW